MASAPRASRWTGRTRGGMAGNRIFVGARAAMRGAGRLPAAGARWRCTTCCFDAPARAASRAYQRRLFGRRGLFAETAWAYRHFYSFGQILLDRVAIAADEGGRFQFAFEGEEHIRSALEGGKGAVLITAHCGNWEAAGRLLRRVSARRERGGAGGGRGAVAAVFRAGDGQRAPGDHPGRQAGGGGDRRCWRRWRAESWWRCRRTGRSTRRKKRFLSWANRRDFRSGPFAAAAVRGAPLMHAFAMREGTYRYHFRAYPPEHPAFGPTAGSAARRTGHSADRAPMLREWMGRFVRRLEETVRQYPLQWHNFYDFWERKEKA